MRCFEIAPTVIVLASAPQRHSDRVSVAAPHCRPRPSSLALHARRSRPGPGGIVMDAAGGWSGARFLPCNSGHFSVWTKCLAKADLDNAVKADATDSLSDIAAEKIAHAYVPPIAGLRALPGDQIVDVVMNEELANNGNLRPLVTTLREIDCAKGRARDLTVIIPMDGQVRTSDTPQDWHYVPNVGELASLSKLLCINSTAPRSKVRWASHAATRSHLYRRSNVPR
jgi:hypothetical protein